MTHEEAIESLIELRDMSCADDEADAPAVLVIEHAIDAIQALAKVRAAWQRYLKSGKLGLLAQGICAALDEASE